MNEYFLSIRGFLTVIALASIAGLVVGCGGDSQSASSTAPASGGGSGSQEATAPSEAGGEEEEEEEEEEDGSSGETTVHTGSLSKSQFIKKASVICERVRKELASGFGEYGAEHQVPSSGPKAQTAAGDFIDTVFVPIYQKQIDQLSELGAPSGDEEEIEAILEAMQKGLQEGQENPLAFIKGAPFLREAANLTASYGLTACSAS
jgi:hypothetical protein